LACKVLSTSEQLQLAMKIPTVNSFFCALLLATVTTALSLSTCQTDVYLAHQQEMLSVEDDQSQGYDWWLCIPGSAPSDPFESDEIATDKTQQI
jgi:hypothetical protein